MKNRYFHHRFLWLVVAWATMIVEEITLPDVGVLVGILGLGGWLLLQSRVHWADPPLSSIVKVFRWGGCWPGRFRRMYEHTLRVAHQRGTNVVWVLCLTRKTGDMRSAHDLMMELPPDLMLVEYFETKRGITATGWMRVEGGPRNSKKRDEVREVGLAPLPNMP